MIDEAKTKQQLISELRELRREIEKTKIKKNITDDKQTEESLSESEDMWRYFAENSPDYIMKLDKDMKIEYINRAAGDYKVEDLIGVPLNSLVFDEKRRKEVEEILENVLRNDEMAIYETEYTPLEGETIYYESRAVTRKRNNKIIGLNVHSRDITEVKLAQIILSKSEDSLNKAQEIGKIGSWEWDIKTDKGIWSQQCYKIFGYEKGEVDITFKFLLTIIHPDDMERVSKRIEKSVKDRESYDMEYRVFRKDGSLCIVYSKAEVTLDNKGNPIGMMGVLQDITDRKKAEEDLENIFKLSPDMVAVCTTEGKFLKINPSWGKVLGYTQKELFDLGWDGLVHPDDVEKTNKEVERQLKGSNVVNFINRYKCKNGAYKILEWQATFAMEGIVYATARDITERKKAEDALKKSEQKFKSYIDSAPHGVYITNSLGQYVDVNEAALITTGYSKDELLKLSIADITAEASLDRGEDAFQKLMKKGKSVVELQYVRKDGKVRWWIINAVKLSDDRFLGFTTDITNHKQGEDELIKAKEKAEESDRLKSAFLANMSHEIRTPMNSVIGFADLLKNEDITIDEKNQFINIINNSGKHLLNLIDDIIDISIIDAGQLEISENIVSINSLISNLSTTFQSDIDNIIQTDVNVILKKGLQRGQDLILCDEMRLQQTLTNLVGNAVKFTKEGIIEIGYKVENKKTLLFYVKDTGIGISKKDQEIIFDRFVQVRETRSTSQSGTGLGLAISKACVERLGGKIWVISAKGRGSTFYFTLPFKSVSKPDIEIIKVKDESLYNKFRNQTILIVEDEENSVLYLKNILKPTKARILTAGDGNEALEICKKNKNINLVLMDIQLPKLSGYEASKTIKSFNKNLPIIALTAFAMKQEKARALSSGCDDYLPKPIDKELLFGKIAKLVLDA